MRLAKNGTPLARSAPDGSFVALEAQAMDIGVFIPIGNNGWIISTTSPQYKPSFELNKTVVQRAEHYGFDFALSMIKFRGFGGKSEFWDYNLESFTLMAGLAAVTTRIKLFASTAVLTLPPAVVARMATTIDSISNGRFGINIVSGWAKGEYDQMGLWPGDAYFGYRYAYSTEYVQVMKDLWDKGVSDFKGKYFEMEDCHMKPMPAHKVELVAAGQSPVGMEFAATYCDYNFVLSTGINKPDSHEKVNQQLLEAVAKTGRDVGAYVLMMVIADETDEKAWAKWRLYKEGVDVDALAWMADQGSKDATAASSGTAKTINLPDQAVNLNIGTFIGSYATVAALLDQAAAVPGTKGLMLTFDDFVAGIETFGQRIQPLMKCRAHVRAAA
jgi:pyrimidine oxygenase